MPQCAKCKKFLPPNFITKISDKDSICEFCKRDVVIIRYGKFNEKSATRSEIVKEYQIFMKKVKERNSILKDAMKDDMKDIPEKLII